MACGIAVDEAIDGFMTETDGMMLCQVAADLLGAQILANEVGDDRRDGLSEFAKLLLIGKELSMFQDLPGPVIGILSIGIPLEFSADRRGMPVQGLGNVLLRPTFPPGLPDVKPFFVADVLIRGYGCRSFRSDGWCRRIIVPE